MVSLVMSITPSVVGSWCASIPNPPADNCYGSALRCRIGRPGVSAAAAATIALASMP